jgi:hypothetical protein
MKKFVFAVVLVALLGAVPASAQVWGALDSHPGATLLLPYFEVNLDDPNGVTTLFSVNNASATAVLTHVTFWTDWSQHSLDFMIYLTGYDVQTVNIRDVFNGFLPVTASVGQDPTDTISPQGPLSQDINFASCNSYLPYEEPELGPFNLNLIRLGHTGQPIPDFGNRCIGENHGDNIARGYVTIDTVNQCTIFFPPDPGYFVEGGAGIATNQNVIWGDFFIVNSSENFAFGDQMVALQAGDPQGNPGTGLSTPLEFLTDDTGYTFWGRYNFGLGADDREPLGTVWSTRFLNGGAFDGGTDLIVWRDSTANNQPAFGDGTGGFSCATGPNWLPLTQYEIVIFDEEENPTLPEGCDISPCPPTLGLLPFPLETQRVEVGGPELGVPFNFGWLYLNLNFGFPDAVTGDVDFGGDELLSQSYVLSSHNAEGRFQVGFPASLWRTALRFSQTALINYNF